MYMYTLYKQIETTYAVFDFGVQTAIGLWLNLAKNTHVRLKDCCSIKRFSARLPVQGVLMIAVGITRLRYISLTTS